MCFTKRISSSVAALTFLTIFTTLCIRGADDTGAVHDGHLKPFGSVGSFVPTDEIDGFPNTLDFFRQYVNPMRPLKMAGAGKLSKSFLRWTDDYFLSLDPAADYRVSIESGKKENRSNPVVDMSFRKFVKTYNSTDHYMVDSVPDFIRLADSIKNSEAFL